MIKYIIMLARITAVVFLFFLNVNLGGSDSMSLGLPEMESGLELVLAYALTILVTLVYLDKSNRRK